mmetsp:Transcript_2742/g.6203  ORF Transcript_2742/g.6203 Transcript_2742/m.6203 type:complete len:356 (-) Transcript_2742:222-1289(-)
MVSQSQPQPHSNILAFLVGTVMASSLVFTATILQHQQTSSSTLRTNDIVEGNHRQLSSPKIDCSTIDPKSLITAPQVHNTNEVQGWIRPDRIFGFVHMVETAGEEINGELASHFERVCGNKGYSHDYYQHNERIKQEQIDITQQLKHSKKSKESVVKGLLNKLHHRTKITSKEIMNEIGIEDCDYIARGIDSSYWAHLSNTEKLELHVPCVRDPLDHLMAQCHAFFKPKAFDCADRDVAHQIEECVNVGVKNRFRNKDLRSNPNIELKCFDPMDSPARYRDYMGTILQRKRVENDFFYHDPATAPRNKEDECVWSAGEEYQMKTRMMMAEKYEYYQFCNECMGSENELPLFGNNV